MFLDPEVEERKFVRELALLRHNEARLRAQGIWLVRAEGRQIDVLVVPRHPMRVAFPAASTATSIILLASQSLQAIELPGVSARAFGARLDLTGYDQRAPSMTFHDPWTWELAPYGGLPIAQIVEPGKKPQIVLLDGHPILKRPFLCMRGVREYHDHPQHDGDDWATYRSATNVYVLLERLARVTVASVRAQLLLTATAGNVNMQMQWAQEQPR